MHELDELRAEVATLRQRCAELEAERPPARAGMSRRLALTGAAAAAGALVTGPRAAALDGDPLVVGDLNGASRQTSLTSNTSLSGQGIPLANTDALLAVDNTSSPRATATAIQAIGRGGAITAVSTGAAGSAVDARSTAADATAVTAVASGPGSVGAVASGAAVGLRAAGSTAGELIGGARGAAVSGARPLVFVSGHGTVGPPVTASTLGEVAWDLDGSLYLCVAAGTPGSWRRIAGPDTAGAFHLLADPRRVYDSRPTAVPLGPSNGGPKGLMTSGETRWIDCTANGAAVPPDATGVMFNLAVTQTNAAGFLTCWGSGAMPLASSMNWSGDGATISNSVTIRLGPNATFSMFCGGGGAAHVIVDVAGYYR